MQKDLENEYFIESLKNRLSEKSLTGVELSNIEFQGEKLCSAQHLSRVLNHKQKPGKNFRAKFASWLGISVREMINEGHHLLNGIDQDILKSMPDLSKRASDIPLSDLNLMEMSSALSLYASSVHKKHIEIATELRKRSEKENQTKKDLLFYRQMLDQSPAIISIISVPDKIIVYRNEMHIKLEEADLIGEVCGKNCILDDTIYDQVVASRGIEREIFEFKNKGIFSILSWPLFGSKGELTHVAYVARDITKRYHEAGIADTAAKRYEAVLAKTARFVLIFDEDKRLVYTNATRRGGMLEKASPLDLETFQSLAMYVQPFLTTEDWQGAIEIVQAIFEGKKKSAHLITRLTDGRSLSTEISAIFDNGTFRGVSSLSQAIKK